MTGTNRSRVCWIGINSSKNGRKGQTRNAANPQNSGCHDCVFATGATASAIYAE